MNNLYPLPQSSSVFSLYPQVRFISYINYILKPLSTVLIYTLYLDLNLHSLPQSSSERELTPALIYTPYPCAQVHTPIFIRPRSTGMQTYLPIYMGRRNRYVVKKGTQLNKDRFKRPSRLIQCKRTF